MSTKAAAKAAETEMVSLKKSTTGGDLVIVRASELAEKGTIGTVAEGIFEGGKPNKFSPEKNDYFVRGENNTLYIVNGTRSLAEQLDQPGLEGMKICIVYNGKKASKKKGGKAWHDFEVFAAKNS